MSTEIQTVKQQVRIKNWEAEVEACNASGLSVQQWCRQNGISAKTYYYHLRKIREKVCEQIPVSIGELSENHGGIRITTSGLTAEIADGTSAETIEAVIRAIKC